GRERVEVLNEFSLPNPYNERNFEGFSLQVFDADVLAVWAWRGKNRAPARIYWGLLAPARDKVSLQGSMPVKAPWPVVCRVPTGEGCEIRHVSDLRVSAKGVLYIAAAADPGNDGPFDSAVYVAGRFHRKGNKFRLQLLSPLTELRRFADSKVEAIEILRDHPRAMVFGSDDENQGGSIYVD
ncbi:MAG: hypothetical protein ACE5LB_17900, partial [Acidiferrobacterales bacterium]